MKLSIFQKKFSHQQKADLYREKSVHVLPEQNQMARGLQL